MSYFVCHNVVVYSHCANHVVTGQCGKLLEVNVTVPIYSADLLHLCHESADTVIKNHLSFDLDIFHSSNVNFGCRRPNRNMFDSRCNHTKIRLVCSLSQRQLQAKLKTSYHNLTSPHFPPK